MKTVCAVSTPRGKGGIAVVRVSGDDAFRVALSVFKPKFASISPDDIDKKYFRRALCGLFGEWAEGGLIPDLDALGKTVQDICYHNAREFFSLGGMEK